MRWIFFFLFLYVDEAFSQSLEHLIYRCDELHWECVNALEFKNCSETRIQEIGAHKRDLSCADFERFPSQRGCEQRVLFLTTHNFGTRFCLNDSVKEKELLF